MQRTEYDPLGPDLAWRLRAEIDRLLPPDTPPWFQPTPRASNYRWQAITGGFALVILGALALSAVFVTGSTNPGVWTHRAGDATKSTVSEPEASPGPDTSASPSRDPALAPPGAQPLYSSPPPASSAPQASGTPAPSAQPKRGKSAGTTGTPEPGESPEQGEAPEPTSPPRLGQQSGKRDGAVRSSAPGAGPKTKS